MASAFVTLKLPLMDHISLIIDSVRTFAAQNKSEGNYVILGIEVSSSQKEKAAVAVAFLR